MSHLRLRLPESLHQAAREMAAKDNISINQLISLALAEKLSALMTEDHLNQRGQRGNRNKFERAMAKIAKAKPVAGDELQ